MGKAVKLEHQAKVTNDNGIPRAKVPIPLLKMMGARPEDYLIFRFTPAGKVTVQVSRSGKGRGKASVGRRRS